MQCDLAGDAARLTDPPGPLGCPEGMFGLGGEGILCGLYDMTLNWRLIGECKKYFGYDGW